MNVARSKKFGIAGHTGATVLCHKLHYTHQKRLPINTTTFVLVLVLVLVLYLCLYL